MISTYHKSTCYKCKLQFILLIICVSHFRHWTPSNASEWDWIQQNMKLRLDENEDHYYYFTRRSCYLHWLLWLWSWAVCDSSMLLTDVGRAIWTAVQNRIRPHHLARSFYEFLENRIPISISTSNVTICPFPFPNSSHNGRRGTAAWYGSLD